jgi:ribosomal protein L40E
MGDNSIQCPKCRHENEASAIECDKCGVTLSLVLKNSIINGVPKPDIPPAASQEAMSPNISICPKCGHDVLPSAAECIKCGIIFSKYFEFQERLQKEEQEKARKKKKPKPSKRSRKRKIKRKKKKPKPLRKKSSLSSS